MISCSEKEISTNSSLPFIEHTTARSLYDDFSAYLNCGDEISLARTKHSYLQLAKQYATLEKSAISVRPPRSINSLYEKYNVNNTESDQLDFIEQNPEKVDLFLKESTSLEFQGYYVESTRIINENDDAALNEFLTQVFEDEKLPSQEKIGLVLFLASDSYKEGELKNFRCVSRRYAKIFTIVTGSMFDAYYSGFDFAVQGAIDELKAMGDKYNCK